MALFDDVKRTVAEVPWFDSVKSSVVSVNRGLAGFFGFVADTVESGEVGRRQWLEEKHRWTMWHMRNQLHNLPYHLNLPQAETEFLAAAYKHLEDLDKPRAGMALGIPYYKEDGLRESLEPKYLGKANFSGPDVTTETFDRIFCEQPDPEAIYFLTGIILLHNFECYQRQPAWWKGMPEHDADADETPWQ